MRQNLGIHGTDKAAAINWKQKQYTQLECSENSPKLKKKNIDPISRALKTSGIHDQAHPSESQERSAHDAFISCSERHIVTGLLELAKLLL